jgi:hypothetical protein
MAYVPSALLPHENPLVMAKAQARFRRGSVTARERLMKRHDSTAAEGASAEGKAKGPPEEEAEQVLQQHLHEEAAAAAAAATYQQERLQPAQQQQQQQPAAVAATGVADNGLSEIKLLLQEQKQCVSQPPCASASTPRRIRCSTFLHYL